MNSSEYLFYKVYDAYCAKLLAVLPEKYAGAIDEAMKQPLQSRITMVRNTVKRETGKYQSQNPGYLLPGLLVTDEDWATLPVDTHKLLWHLIPIITGAAVTTSINNYGGTFSIIDDLNTATVEHVRDILIEDIRKIHRILSEKIIAKQYPVAKTSKVSVSDFLSSDVKTVISAVSQTAAEKDEWNDERKTDFKLLMSDKYFDAFIKGVYESCEFVKSSN